MKLVYGRRGGEWDVEHTKLLPGRSYRFSKDVNLVPDPEPEDYIKAIKNFKTLKAYTIVEVMDRKEVRYKTWYKTIHGWINEIALIGAVYEEVKQEESSPGTKA